MKKIRVLCTICSIVLQTEAYYYGYLEGTEITHRKVVENKRFFKNKKILLCISYYFSIAIEIHRDLKFFRFRISWNSLKIVDCHAVGMAVAQPLDFEIDFARNPISGSAAWFFVIILKFIFTDIFEIKNYVKKFLGTKKISFSKPDFHKPTYIYIK